MNCNRQLRNRTQILREKRMRPVEKRWRESETPSRNSLACRRTDQRGKLRVYRISTVHFQFHTSGPTARNVGVVISPTLSAGRWVGLWVAVFLIPDALQFSSSSSTSSVFDMLSFSISTFFLLLLWFSMCLAFHPYVSLHFSFQSLYFRGYHNLFLRQFFFLFLLTSFILPLICILRFFLCLGHLTTLQGPLMFKVLYHIFVNNILTMINKTIKILLFSPQICISF